MSYRVGELTAVASTSEKGFSQTFTNIAAELSKSNRAKCQATQCKNEGTKIEKNALRQGVLVTMKENTTMKWRHW